MIPAYIVYEGRVYIGSGGVYKTGASVPADLSFLGSATAALDGSGAADPSLSYDIYAIAGVDPSQSITVKFRAASNDGPLWAWLRYERKR
jgi:hypothetical protein